MKNYYVLDVGTYMCHLIIKINDVEVFSLNIDGQMSTEIPINMGILESGMQAIQVIGLPANGEKELEKESYIRYKVMLYDVSGDKFVLIKNFENQYTPAVKKGIPIIVHESTFQAEVPYKLEAWQKGKNLKDVKFNIKEKLIEEYNKIVSSINSGDFQSFYKKREENNAISMYLTNEQSSKRVGKIIDHINKGYKAIPITNSSILDFSGYGKIVSLKRTDGYSALYLDNDEFDEEIILQLAFFLPEDKEEFEIY